MRPERARTSDAFVDPDAMDVMDGVDVVTGVVTVRVVSAG
jgi:hypothetical protein